MRISDWSSDVCSSDLATPTGCCAFRDWPQRPYDAAGEPLFSGGRPEIILPRRRHQGNGRPFQENSGEGGRSDHVGQFCISRDSRPCGERLVHRGGLFQPLRTISEENKYEPQYLITISYTIF